MNETKPPRYWQGNWWQNPEQLVGLDLKHDIYEYKLIKFLKKGGFSCTYLAEQKLVGAPLPRKVVVKILYIANPGHAIEKLRRAVVEAYVLGIIGQDLRFVCQAANSRTPHYKPEEITTEVAHRLYLNQRGQPYYFHVLIYMSGDTLRAKIKQEGHLSEKEAIKIAVQAGENLAYLHTTYHILHRDINPSNLLSDGNGKWLWTDFGLAKLKSENGLGRVTTPRINATVADHPGGTDGYIPLEASNDGDSAQRDVYALAVTALEMLTGLLAPRKKENPHWYQDWRPTIENRLNQIKSPKLRMILAKGLAEKKENRYQTVAEFTRALQQYQATQKPVQISSSLPAINWTAAAQEAQKLWRTATTTFKRGWQKLTTQRYTLPTAPLTSNSLLAKISESPVSYVLPAIFIMMILNLWLGAWPEFYGTRVNQSLPALLAALALVRPGWAALSALICLMPLLLALSPLLSVSGLLLTAYWGYGLQNWPQTKQKEYTIIGCSIALAPVLADWRIALAVPVTIGMVYGRTRHTTASAAVMGLLTGVLTFLTLSLWATLIGAATLEPVFLFDPYQQAPYRFWITDFSFAAMMGSEFQTIWREIWRDDPTAILNQFRVVWLASIAPLWGLISWSLAGAIAAIISKKRHHTPPRSIWNGLPASGWAVATFVSLYWLMAQTPGMPDWGIFPFITIGLLSLLATNFVAAIDYFWRN